MTVSIDGLTLTGDQVLRVARPTEGRFASAALDAAARAKVVAARAYIDANFMRDDAPLMYSFNTGVGLFKDQRVMMAEMAEYQRKTVYAHATGIGEPFAEDVTRATMLLRANAFASNYSGPRIEVVDRLLACLNAGLHPVIPQKGSVGASGDLAPLAHMSGAICGFDEAEMIYKGRRMPAREALREAGLDVDFPLSAKDASALINGSTVSLALAVLAIEDAKRILKHADIAMTLSLECMRGELAAFDPRVHAARPHEGQAASARNIRRIVEGSQRCSEEARVTIYPDENRAPGKPPAPRVQDVYSLRCTPQVHGPMRDALGYVGKVIGTEINSATDNPLIFDDGEGGYTCISGGHFHGQYVAQVMDLLAIATTDLGSISERRLARLIDPTMSYGLPRNLLAGKRGLNTGYATVQCSMSALVMENRTLSTPGSVDSIPGKSNAEDHVSNSTWCGRKARTVVENVEQIVACEILMAGQALSLVEEHAKDHPIGKGSRAALEALRSVVKPALSGDRWYHHEMIDALALVRSGAIVEAVEAAVGPLE
ncbi:aromatic amino acid lyase [Bradyrhizobium sp. U87765 SZCCT0131]|uniref:HAL/PAL/TAL family ammonia-lyase n=1 Tax=unclassified Bradyrhizobium TaxID=2631580 RepID=UPI001BA8F4B2|nr:MULTISPECIES: aromatic amino acid ammonia-lyase [unclassified Bradyrhizobium]MBR1221719.1 aromatic amino acid lyase [Bradyrhizobium sp. U87765 SZCCT0131]MBR1264358.1 aromatic amino acid lyase [Bradyrhizobium sp. U87765 SZCCT0134]MBR1304735.1 aromatic amino acid lyase [Bradyrhizobium sp. U87765 SZCCT0110]MBR1322408.1 aromatic amino acid lyase [Bradyrhizobium sp. U87765 SZCCT0109]MBR1346664.1 aromatic amino acid lyase [Bradyrhizobium sp. U87765 SZCCT0048]